jgi:hypothetical protein
LPTNKDPQLSTFKSSPGFSSEALPIKPSDYTLIWMADNHENARNGGISNSERKAGFVMEGGPISVASSASFVRGEHLKAS